MQDAKMMEVKTKQAKIKINIYLSYPSNTYYEMMILSDDIISNILVYIEKIFPKDKYDYVYIYKNDKPVFINYETGEEINIAKTYVEHGFYNKESPCNNVTGSDIHEPECSIKIKLKVIKLKDMNKGV